MELVLLLAVVAAPIIAIAIIRASKKARRDIVPGVPHRSTWPQTLRTELSTFRETYEGLTKTLSQIAKSNSAFGLQPEILSEANRLYALAYDTARRQVQIKEAIHRSQKMRSNSALLEDRMEKASPTEKESLQNSLKSYGRIEVSVAKMQAALDRLDVQMRESEAALIELHSQVLASSAIADDSDVSSDDLRSVLGRVRTISKSIEEADDMVSTDLN